VFRLLPVNPGPDVSTAAAAVLADLPVGQVRQLLDDLAEAYLVEAAGKIQRPCRPALIGAVQDRF
jgi:hypothetical protein